MAKVSLTKRELSSGELPLLCMKCGKTVRKPIEITLTYWPNAVRAAVFTGLVFAFGLGGAIAYAFLRKKIVKFPSQIPICSRHRNMWKKPLQVIFGSLIAGNVLMFLILIMSRYNQRNTSQTDVNAFYISMIFLVIGMFIGNIMIQTAVIIESVNGNNAKFNNISEKFIAALIEHRESDEEAEVIDDDEGFEVIEEPPSVRKRRRNED